MRTELSQRALDDIKDIARYTIENFGRAQADEYLGGLYHSFDILGDNSKIGQVIPETTVRRYIYRMHYVFYEIREDVIRVAHIRHTSMELPEWWRT
ncbi:MAG: type II toxin-antitoxin system RelE/ParE family toxin [Pseudomonadota bacterium]